jgi:hypothetical protein
MILKAPLFWPSQKDKFLLVRACLSFSQKINLILFFYIHDFKDTLKNKIRKKSFYYFSVRSLIYKKLFVLLS